MPEGVSAGIPHNLKLTTLGVVAGILGLIGVIVLRAGSAQDDALVSIGFADIGGALLGSAFSVWITWLAIGSRVDTCSGFTRRPKPAQESTA